MSNFKSYDWDFRNVFHILKHEVTPNEVEEACYNDPIVLKSRQWQYLVYGRTAAGRYLFVVINPQSQGRVRVVTAREMTQKEKNFSKKRRGIEKNVKVTKI